MTYFRYIRNNYIKMPVNLASIGKNSVKMVPSMKEVKLESLWAEQTVVVTFFRRFGCVFCRQGAKELSLLTPLLASHNVKNIGVGLEEFGLEEFVEGKFFNGDLYVDIEKKTYQDLGYKRYGTFGVMMSLFSKTARDALAKVSQPFELFNVQHISVITISSMINCVPSEQSG